MKDFKYIKNLTEDGTGTILIYNQIGNSIDEFGNQTYGISGSDFANEMLYLQSKCKDITVRINSIGGSVLDGYAIVSSILNCSKPVNTIIDGLAASTALWCATAGKTCKAMDYATGMIHNSSGAEDKALQNLVDSTINTILSNRSNKSMEEISAMMKKETWLNATQLKECGIVDEVISSGKKVKIKKNESLMNMALIYNKLITPNMSKINTLLKLSNTAEENEQVDAIANLNAATASKDAEIADLKAKLQAIEDENKAKEESAKADLLAKATEMVNKAVADKKITETEKANVLINAASSQSGFDFVKNMFDKISDNKTAVKVFDVKNVKTNKGAEDRSNWDFNEWSKKDSKGLLEIKNTNPELFNEIYNKTFKK